MISQRYRRICFVMPFHIQEMRGGGAEVQAWLLAKDDGMVPIPGTKHQKYVEENAAAADLGIPIRDLERAGEIINQHTVAGARYAESQMISLDPEE